MIQLSGVDVRHHEHVVLSDIHLEVRPGELVYLVGRTGSGKSSLLRTLYGDLSLSSGEGRVCDVDLKKVTPRNVHVLRRKLGMVFQDFGLLEDRSVDERMCPSSTIYSLAARFSRRSISLMYPFCGSLRSPQEKRETEELEGR